METSYEPLYQKIYNDIREKIKSGRIAFGHESPHGIRIDGAVFREPYHHGPRLKELANDGTYNAREKTALP